jgi:SAM-dependent methyltransferase
MKSGCLKPALCRTRHVAIGLEGAAQFAAMARAYSGCEVWQQDFLKLDLPENYFDGIFAKAPLFHVPSQELPRVLLELRACLKPGGVRPAAPFGLTGFLFRLSKAE